MVDAGNNVIGVNTTIPLYFGRAVEEGPLSAGGLLMLGLIVDPAIELNYTYNEYSPGAQFPRNDGWYPRARALGGSTVLSILF